MIKVIPQPEPVTFEDLVRQPGKAHLASLAGKSPLTDKDFEGHDYWSRCHDELFSKYNGICAYYCVKLNRTHGLDTQSTVDHYKPKKIRADIAYEWSNYRLASATANVKKGDKKDIIDPCCIEDRWFRLNFITGNVEIKNIPQAYRDIAQKTINSLLNHRKICEYRLAIFEDCKKDLSKLTGDPVKQQDRKSLLQQESPFVYAQALRQNKL